MTADDTREAAQAFIDHVAEAASWPTPGVGCDTECEQGRALRAALAAARRDPEPLQLAKCVCGAMLPTRPWTPGVTDPCYDGNGNWNAGHRYVDPEPVASHPVWNGTGTCPYCGVFVPEPVASADLVLVRKDSGGVFPDGTTNHPAIDFSETPPAIEAAIRGTEAGQMSTTKAGLRESPLTCDHQDCWTWRDDDTIWCGCCGRWRDDIMLERGYPSTDSEQLK